MGVVVGRYSVVYREFTTEAKARVKAEGRMETTGNVTLGTVYAETDGVSIYSVGSPWHGRRAATPEALRAIVAEIVAAKEPELLGTPARS